MPDRKRPIDAGSGAVLSETPNPHGFQRHLLANAQLARVPALPYLKRPKDADFRTAATDSTGRTEKWRNAVMIFLAI